MNKNFQEITCKATGAKELYKISDIQSLWSGYGKIMRYGLMGSDRNTVIIKHVQPPNQTNHPRGWNTDLSHLRKVKSYQVESAWYRLWSKSCDENCRIPQCLALETEDDSFLMVLEDLDESGYPLRKSNVSIDEMHVCLSWLANFHATFMGKPPTELWKIGTYWHLETRPDELNVLKDNNLKKAAKAIDEKLNNSPYQTFVHGDAKLANFCFSKDGEKVAAVDFQYVGGGCGMKDVAYFIGSCLYEDDCERYEEAILDYYFLQLKTALKNKNSDINTEDLEQNWRELFPVAWSDFHRFVKGWSPDHWKIHGYSERITQQVISQL